MSVKLNQPQGLLQRTDRSPSRSPKAGMTKIARSQFLVSENQTSRKFSQNLKIAVSVASPIIKSVFLSSLIF